MSAKQIIGGIRNEMNASVNIQRYNDFLVLSVCVLECECNIYGAETAQCDRKSGACKCLPGIGGFNCDECDRGYLGLAPSCTPCGECFENWDRILKGHKSNNIFKINFIFNNMID